MNLRENLSFIIFCIWSLGFVLFMAIGLSVRFGLYGWQKYQFQPGEEALLLTGKNHGLFCETVTLEATGYLSGQNLQIWNWNDVEKTDLLVDHFAIHLEDRNYDFRKYRLNPGDFMNPRICSEQGLTLYTALSQEAFLKLTADLKSGKPCPVTNPIDDPFCGKLVVTKNIPAAGKCEWLQPNEDFNQAMTFRSWHETRVQVAASTEVFLILVTNKNARNSGKNLLEIRNYKRTNFDNTANVISECIHQKMCMFAFDFDGSQAVFIKLDDSNHELSTPVDVWTYCKPRDWFFVLLFCFIPVIFLGLATFLVCRRTFWGNPIPVVYL